MVGVNDLEGFSQHKEFCDSKDRAYGQLELWDNIFLPGTILKTPAKAISLRVRHTVQVKW